MTAALATSCGHAAAWRLPSGPAAVPAARGLCRGTLSGWGVPPDAVGDAAQVVSELVTNGVIHGADPVIVQVGRSPDEVVVAVYDAGAGMPVPRDPSSGADDGSEPSGWGLAAIVTALSSRWTVTRAWPAGKTVTAYLPLPGQQQAGRTGTGAARASPAGPAVADDGLSPPCAAREASTT